jgi:hypothetical protein
VFTKPIAAVSVPDGASLGFRQQQRVDRSNGVLDSGIVGTAKSKANQAERVDSNYLFGR